MIAESRPDVFDVVPVARYVWLHFGSLRQLRNLAARIFVAQLSQSYSRSQRGTWRVSICYMRPMKSRTPGLGIHLSRSLLRFPALATVEFKAFPPSVRKSECNAPETAICTEALNLIPYVRKRRVRQVVQLAAGTSARPRIPAPPACPSLPHATITAGPGNVPYSRHPSPALAALGCTVCVLAASTGHTPCLIGRPLRSPQPHRPSIHSPRRS